MIRELGLLCLLSSASLSPAPNTCGCNTASKPVCASDGRTYRNMCLFNCVKSTMKKDLELESQGRCDECTCVVEYEPVCANDRDFPNRCILNCYKRATGKKITAIHDGTCRRKRESVRVAELPPPVCACSFDINPVCGSDGQTYDNPCMLKCTSETNADLTFGHMGACEHKFEVDSAPASCVCTKVAQPVCGTDGNTYANTCRLNCARVADESLRIEHAGPCAGAPGAGPGPGAEAYKPDCACTRNLRPVCASDGLTYNNACLMQCAGSHLTVVKDEPCA